MLKKLEFFTCGSLLIWFVLKQVPNPNPDFVAEIPSLANFNGENSRIGSSWRRFANIFHTVPDCFSLSLFSTFICCGVGLVIRQVGWCMKEIRGGKKKKLLLLSVRPLFFFGKIWFVIPLAIS